MKFIIGLIVGLVVLPIGAYMYFASGRAPVAATDSNMPFEEFLAHKALDARLERDTPKIMPVQANEANYVAGAELYKQHCAVCHGLPLSPKTAIATGMYPDPPRLMEGKGVTDDPPGESYWKIANGLRLTGMPGFSKSLSETQMWQIALLVANADKLPSTAKMALVATVGGNTAATAAPDIAPVPPPPTFPSSTPPPK